jgi:hypothetical protein
VVRNILFHRNFQNFTGGHLKVWDYFNHVNAAPDHHADIYFSPDTRWDSANPWLDQRARALSEWVPHEADLLFLGGHDWLQLPEPARRHFPRPVINLIQHVQHGDSAHPLAAYLPNRAIRICVSEEVVIPNGIDLPATEIHPPAERPIDWLICGVKEGQSALARELARRMAPFAGADRIEVLTKLLPRADFLARLARARRAVLLPRATEGFYLPALEAMALGTLVICPDCLGNRSFCRDGVSAIVPAGREVDALLSAMRRARDFPEAAQAAILANARAIAARHSLASERAAFHRLLASVGSLW